MDSHPGGAFLLEHNVGRDISKFFHGGHALDGNLDNPVITGTPRHTHTNIARKIASDLAIGTYSGKT